MKKIVYILMLSMFSLCATAQKESDNVRTGNKLYKAEKFTEAEIEYRKGLLKNSKSFEASYNLGNALFKQKKYPEALEQYTSSIELKPSDKNKLAAALHNTGNALFADKKISESIDAFKKALKMNPTDNDTRYNLAYAQSMLKKQQQDKDKNKENQDKNQDKKDQNKEQNKDQNKPQEQQQNKPQMSKQNAQQILDALQQDEKNAQDKAKKQQVRGTKDAEKNW